MSLMSYTMYVYQHNIPCKKNTAHIQQTITETVTY